jgi:hypothetical protein
VLLLLRFFVYKKRATFATIFRVKKCHFHYDMQKHLFYYQSEGGYAKTILAVMDKTLYDM